MAMSDADFAEQERRATMQAAGFDVGKVDGPALCNEVREVRRRAADADLMIVALRLELQEARLELARRSAVTFSAGEHAGSR